MRLTVLLPALTFLLAAGVGDASACSCQPSGPPCQNYFQSDAVFIGTVRSITPAPATWSGCAWSSKTRPPRAASQARR